MSAGIACGLVTLVSSLVSLGFAIAAYVTTSSSQQCWTGCWTGNRSHESPRQR